MNFMNIKYPTRHLKVAGTFLVRTIIQYEYHYFRATTAPAQQATLEASLVIIFITASCFAKENN